MKKRWQLVHRPLIFGLALLGAMLLGLFVHTSKTAWAAGPSVISFQGKVVNADGTNVTNGTYNFDFVLYDDPSLGSPSDGVHDKWHELSKSVSVTNGVFQTNLGSATALPDFNTNNSLYLAIRFNADAAGYMSPRIQMGSVPYALNADKLGGLSSGGFIQNQTSGQQSASSFWISGSGRADTSLLSPAVDVAASGTLSLGTGLATGVTIGSTTNTTAILLQGAAGTTYTIGGTSTTGTITLGQSTASNTISIGSGIGSGNTQTISLGTGSAGTTNITIGNSAAGTVVIGGASNNTTFTSGTFEPVLNGTARHTNRISLTPEYAGATMTGSGTNNTGTMTSDNEIASPFHNFYKWTTTSGTAQTYDVWVRVPLPMDFAAWCATTNCNPTVYLYTKNSASSASSVQVATYSTANATVQSLTNIASANTSWNENSVNAAASAQTWAAGGYMTLQIRMSASSSSTTQIGELRMDYLSKW